MSTTVAIALFTVLVAGALWGVETGRRGVLLFCKPAATAALLPVVLDATEGLLPRGHFAWLVTAGILLSLVGDVALLDARPRAFLTGLASFLLAHVCYTLAFLTMARPGIATVAAIAVAAATSVTMVRSLWKRLHRLRAPVAAYAAAISAMVIVAVSTIGGVAQPVASFAIAGGAFLFYLSDANLAWIHFGRVYPHAQTITLGLYWSGQLGIALGARWVG